MTTFLFKIKRLFGIKRPRTLGDVDSLSMADADKIGLLPKLSPTPNIDAILREEKTRLCKKCRNGKLKMVQPEITMDGKYLYECEACEERCYR